MPLPPAFRRLGWSNLLAQCSEQLALAAAPLAAVLLLGAGPAEAGWLQTAQTLPFLLLSIPAGVLADRTSRRRLMTGAELLRAASLAMILALLLAGALNLTALAVLGGLGAVGTVAYSVAAPALVPALVPRPHLAAANRVLELARSIAFAAGPALGGTLVGWLGAPPAFALALALSLLAATALSGLPDTAPPAAPPRRVWAEIREGAGFVLAHPLLRPVLLTAVLFNTAWFVLQAVYVAYAVQRLALDAAAVGMTLGLYGAGMVAGALAAPRLLAAMPFGRLVVVGPACALVAALLVLLTVAAPQPALAGLGLFLFGAGPVLWTIATTTLRQAVTPQRMLGRVSAVVMTATFGARPLGAALGALLAGAGGAEAALALSALLFAAQFVVILASPVPGLRALPQDA
ncbi:MFS transporter [Roseomonas haemaphysalidis]|uniref:MFS transporter n=1 Tax=Roseomonas haemaphysalidis TaxID=2768162 RepID=A0ABS3KNC0_9PROT|nr:MFS transporter [Roseomonas haemaphysalidis]MBO1078952.1 MFS transporter [Roseomonas haemaphysalidis]